MSARRLAGLGAAVLVGGMLAAAGPSATSAAQVQANTTSVAVPDTIVMDGEPLASIRQHPDPAALAFLLHRADDALRAGPWPVMDKTATVSPDKHDYFSLAT